MGTALTVILVSNIAICTEHKTPDFPVESRTQNSEEHCDTCIWTARVKFN